MLASSTLKKLRDKIVLVTGGTGLIGRQVVDILCKAGAKVTIVSLDRVAVHEQAEHILGDLTDLDFCKEITAGTEYVFHLAGIKGSIEVSRISLPAILLRRSC